MASSSKGSITNAAIIAHPGSTVNSPKVKNKNVYVQPAPPKKKIRQIGSAAENFVGRTEEIEKIHAYFNALTDRDANPLNRMCIITGSPGMGKSHLAMRFAEFHSESYPCVAFLNSETKDSLDASFTQLAVELGLIEEDEDEPHQKKLRIDIKSCLPKIYKALSDDYDRMLFIFDNAVALKSVETLGIHDYLLEGYLPMPFFLVTSRNPDFWDNQTKALKILPLSLLPDEATHEFLLKMSHLDELTPDLEELFTKITSILEGYPLGLKLMSEVKTTRRAGSSDQERFKQRLKVYLKVLENVHNKFATQKLKADELQLQFLGAIFEVKVETILKEHKDAVKLLGILSCMNVYHINLKRCYGIFYGIPVLVGTTEWSGGMIKRNSNKNHYMALSATFKKA